LLKRLLLKAWQTTDGDLEKLKKEAAGFSAASLHRFGFFHAA
jgi:hypothetical protein